MKKNSDKKMLFEMMHKVGGMPLNENYPMGAAEDPNAPYNEPEDNGNNEPDPDEYRDDMSEANTGINPKYTHFAALKSDNKIVNGWDYNGYEPAELKQFKSDYFFVDIKDMDIDPRLVAIYTKRTLERKGINPLDSNNWYKFNKDVDEGWGRNLAAGAMMTAASLGGMSGAQAQQTAANEPVKQGIENVDNNQQQKTFYNMIIGIAKHRDNPKSTIEAKQVYTEIINYYVSLRDGKTPNQLSPTAITTVKNWYEMIKNTKESHINTFITLGQQTTT